MASVYLALPPDYWKNLSLNKKDLEFIGNYLFDKETPLTEKELVPVLIEERIRSERDALTREQRAAGKAYLPKEQYKSGDQLVFPALDWAKGKVTGVRAGVNPAIGEFSVMEVEFEDGSKRSFATSLADHKLNQPPEEAGDAGASNQAGIYQEYGRELENRLAETLRSDEGLVRIAGRWFPRALLVDVNMGHLNLAEAVLDEASGGPLSTSAMLEQVELPGNVNPKLIEFSMNYALQEDGRFDEVGPAGEVLWYLKRLEPGDVQMVPAPLRYMPTEYDRTRLNAEMLAQEAEIDDELGENAAPKNDLGEVTVTLTFPHWRAGTLPVSARVHGLFPTAYESPRVRFTLVDAKNNGEIPAWVVRQHRYVSGLAEYYKKYELIPGSLITLRKGKKPGQTIIEARTHRPTRDWVRTVLAGSDGGIVFAMLKQNLSADFNERMVIAVPDVNGVDEASAQLAKQRPSFDTLVHNMMVELVKLNVQGHVHVQELYSALNVIQRCPPAPLLAFLARESSYKHVGDMHFRLAETEGGND
jgi:hypothetical protein